MRDKMLLSLLILALAGLFSCRKTGGAKNPELLPGDPIPEFELRTLYGGTVSSSSLKGEGTVILFFNTWCPDCHEWLPVIQEWADADETDTIYLCIARDQTNEAVMAFWDDNGYTMTAAGDPGKKVYDLFTGDNGYGVPVLYFIDENGICVNRILQNKKLKRK